MTLFPYVKRKRYNHLTFVLPAKDYSFVLETVQRHLSKSLTKFQTTTMESRNGASLLELLKRNTFVVLLACTHLARIITTTQAHGKI